MGVTFSLVLSEQSKSQRRDFYLRTEINGSDTETMTKRNTLKLESEIIVKGDICNTISRERNDKKFSNMKITINEKKAARHGPMENVQQNTDNNGIVASTGQLNTRLWYTDDVSSFVLITLSDDEFNSSRPKHARAHTKPINRK